MIFLLPKLNLRFNLGKIFLLNFVILFLLNTNISANTNTKLYELSISKTHPRIFINSINKSVIKQKAHRILSEDLSLLTKRMRHDKIPSRLGNLRDYIYKYAYLYQITDDMQWASLAITAMEKFPAAIAAHGGANNGYGYAVEGLAIGFDWCYEPIQRESKTQFFISLINKYYIENRKNFNDLPDFHNYAAQAEIAMLLAGLSTYGENPLSLAYISEARAIMEYGLRRNGIYYNVKDSVAFVDGACNWEGVTYIRRTLFSYIKYIEALRTASQGRINLWDDAYSSLENAGYYIMYSLRSDSLFENIGDVNYRSLSYFDINNLSALQSTFKNPYFTTFLKKNAKWHKSKFEKGIWAGYLNTSLIFYLMWFDPDLPKGNLNDLPIAKKFGDIIIIRNGFGKNDTHITFKAGSHYGFHSQLDHGSFTIFKGSPLVIDSGYYDSLKWGKQHVWNYWKRTIAHNSLLIYNPDEKSFTYPMSNKRKIINDGGQRFVFRKLSPPHILTGYSNHPKSADYIAENFEELSMGKITEYESHDDYVFINADLTNAYDNSFSGRGTNQPKRVNSVERQFLYLNSDHLIIFDKIDAINKDYEKTWLLHSGSYYDKTNKPELDGTLKLIAGKKDAGITESLDSNIIKITNGDNQLIVKTLLPAKHKTRRIGGENYEFWVQGENKPIAGKEKMPPKNRKNEDPGAWRVEIQPIMPSKYDEFLHVLAPHYKSLPSPTQINNIETYSPQTAGVHIEDKNNNLLVVFSILKDTPTEKLRYISRSNEKIRHLITGVKPNTYYKYTTSISKGNYIIEIQKNNDKFGILSSPQGILYFTITPSIDS